MKILDLISPDRCWIVEEAHTRDSLLSELSSRLADQLPHVDQRTLFEELIKREERGTTATPEGVAFPHTMVQGIEESLIAVALLQQPADFSEPEGFACDLVFLLLGPPGSEWQHLRTLARLARVCMQPAARETLRSSMEAAELHRRIVAEDAKHV